MENTQTRLHRLADTLRSSVPHRLRAVAIHLAISAVIFVAALYLIVVDWYPGFHFAVDGGWQGVRIMVGVDLVLGPALTLVIFNPFKARRLIVFDLTCIGVAQLAALGWGFYAVHSQRPVSVNYWDGAFYGMTAEPMKIENYPLSLLAELSAHRPALVYVAPPAPGDEETRMAMLELLSGIAPHEDPLRFKALAPNWKTAAARARNAEKHARSDPEFARELGPFLARQGGQASDYRFFPYTGRYGTCTAAFRASGEFLGALGCRAA